MNVESRADELYGKEPFEHMPHSQALYCLVGNLILYPSLQSVVALCPAESGVKYSTMR